MFALADWMNMKDSENTRKQKFEKECNPPPISESLKKIKQNAIDRQEIQKWVKRDIKIEKLSPQLQQSRNARISHIYYR